MIRRTFCFLPGIGARFERHIWREGAFTWDDFLSMKHIRGISRDRKAMYDTHLADAISALNNSDSVYFLSRLDHTEHWRMFNEFRKDSVCLDIETTGTSPGENAVTIVGLYDCHGMKTFIQGTNFDHKILTEVLSQYKLLITFAGNSFDVPFLKKCFPGFSINLPHFDLCPAGHRLGLKGGLKKVEAYLGIGRDEDLTGMSGYDAVILWNRYIRGDNGALDLLVRYNEADTKNLYNLAEIIYERLCIKYDRLLPVVHRNGVTRGFSSEPP